MTLAINLLPWRDSARHQARKQLIVRSLLLAALTGALGTGIQLRLHQDLDQSLAAVNRVAAMHRHLDWQDTVLAELSARSTALEGRLQQLEQIDRQRRALAGLLADIATAAPEGPQFDTLLREDRHILISGRARSATLVASLAGGLDATLEELQRLPAGSGAAGEHAFRIRLDWYGATDP